MFATFVSSQPPTPSPKSKHLYVKNLADTVTDEQFNEEFGVYGNIISARIMRDKDTQASRGFGFVVYTKVNEAKKAFSKMNGKMLNGKKLSVSFFSPNAADEKPAAECKVENEGDKKGENEKKQQDTVNNGDKEEKAPPSSADPTTMRRGLPGVPLMCMYQPMYQPLYQPMYKPMGQPAMGAFNGCYGYGYQVQVRAPVGMPLGMPQFLPMYAPNNMGVPVGSRPGLSEADQKIAFSKVLRAAPPSMQKGMIAAKITDMLSKVDSAELIKLMESSDVLSSKINEALAVIRASTSTPQSST